jgi:ABC-type Fe3+-hydroxamate transport system substrate-binding protein
MTVRIVSLVPSSTETLLALGADVVACTRFC